MSKYNWKFATLGGATRVKISTGEDLRHLGDLDQKMWTVLSCPTAGLEIPEDTLRLLDTDGDGKIRINEVVSASQWLCGLVKNADIFFAESDEMSFADFSEASDEAQQMLEVGKRLAGDADVIRLQQVVDAIAAVTIEEQVAEVKELPTAPYDDAIMSAYAEDKETYNAYFTDLRLEKLGLKKTDPEAAPAIKEEEWEKMAAAIEKYNAEKAAIEAENAAAAQAAADANAAALAAATADYQPLCKFLKLKRDFYTLLKNYVAFEDFYGEGKKAIFQCGTLIIDQRACDLCVRVQDAAAMGTDAGLSGMYLLFCDCVNKTQGKSMSIIACVSVGDVDDLFVGKNAIFYDRSGLDYDAKVTKIIDNPISIKQAFFSPYIKFGNWIKNLINKSAAEKEAKSFDNLKTGAADTTAQTAETAENSKKAQAFDIAKFAGIFAAIGMALGFIGSFFVSLGKGISALTWWQLILVIIGILLCISGPSMFIAWLKLRRRNIAPVLNSNGWAINARSLVSVKFGQTLTTSAQFPKVKGSGLKCVLWTIVLVVLVAGGLWLANCLDFAGLHSPLPRYNQPVEEVVAEETATEAVAEEPAVEDAAVEEATVAEEV